MNKKQAARIGGLTRADSMTDSERYQFAASGGRATRAAYGRAHFVRLAHARWEAHRNAKAAAAMNSDGATH